MVVPMFALKIVQIFELDRPKESDEDKLSALSAHSDQALKLNSDELFFLLCKKDYNHTLACVLPGWPTVRRTD